PGLRRHGAQAPAGHVARRPAVPRERVPLRDAPWVYDRLHNRLGGRIGMLELDDLEGVDIDTELDFALAEQQMDQYLAVHKVLRHRSDLGAPRTAETPTTGPNRTPGGAQ
ncbi:hypothetical protein ACNQUF_11760, partial [Corynebacterium diphtheriae]